MAVLFLLLSLTSAGVLSAPPPAPQSAPSYHLSGQPQLHQLNSIEYYLEHPEYYQQRPQQQHQPSQRQKQGQIPNSSDGPARLESLEPDSEVEILPGAQQPQQPPQQHPVSPNVPGLVPGQRVFIVHMPVAGYRPGTIGGYQPVYIVAAAPAGNNNNLAPNGYQTTFLVDTTGQGAGAQYPGYPRGLAPGANQPAYPGYQGNPSYQPQAQPGYQLQGNPGYQYQGTPGYPVQGVNPGYQGGNPGYGFPGPNGLLARPYDYLYQDPAFAYQSSAGVAPSLSAGDNGRQSVRLAQLVSLQHQGQASANLHSSTKDIENGPQSARLTEASEDKPLNEQPRREVRPMAKRNKA